jgi:hypothetical protein
VRRGEPIAASPAAARLPQVFADGDGVLVDDAAGLAVRLRLRHAGSLAVVVTAVEPLPSWLSATLPDGGLVLAPSGGADLLLRWAGPACTAEVPDRLLPEVTLTVLADDLPTSVTVETSRAERTLRDAWRAACDDSGRLG